MNFKATKTLVNGLIGRMSLKATLLVMLSGCGTVLVDLEAGREKINPLLSAAAGAVADGTREEAASSVRDLIASVDCLLDNPECPDD